MEEEKVLPCLGMLSSGVVKILAVPAAVSVILLVLVFTGGFFSSVDVFNFGDPSVFSMADTEPSSWRMNCTSGTEPRITCPSNYPTSLDPNLTSAGLCPEYFRWLHEDLRPWKETGIMREMLERPKAREYTHFRLVVINGKEYLETFKKSYKTRDVFTVWGILQLLRLYPGKLPDMFCCDDATVILKSDYPENETSASPPLFHYCWKNMSIDIPFPDWSFWGWPEVNISPWEMTLSAIRERSKMIKWVDRQPLAYWKGNPLTKNRAENWRSERREGLKTSNLEDQCKYRYKIYIEGRAWSVSEKYIMACNSTTLMVTRGMFPLEHYWPIRTNNKCRDIKFAVEWGNKNPSKAQKMGETGTEFIEKSVKIGYVYDYMLHALTEYAKLLRFKPEVPSGVTEICSETMACPAEGLVKRSMLDSLVTSPSDSLPCMLPPPFDPVDLDAIEGRKTNAIRQVNSWVAEYYRKKQA